MQQRLDSDVDRVSSALRGELIIINARSMDQQHSLTVAPGDQIFAAVGGAFGNVSDTSLTVKHTVPASFAHTYREAREDSERSPLLLICWQVAFGDDMISPGDTFADWSIEDGARLDVSVRARRTVQEIAEATAALNAGITAATLMQGVKVDRENASRVLGSLDWNHNGLVALPECIGDLIVEGDLKLGGRYQLSSLPEGIGGINVGEDLDLSGNELSSLPESIANLHIVGALNLGNNQLSSLPEGIGSLTVDWNLMLYDNQLSSLPEGIGGITVGGNLWLNDNQLSSLPQSFGSISVGCDLYLHSNQIPESVWGALPQELKDKLSEQHGDGPLYMESSTDDY